jgi:broad specificity phosphatase PhoE
MVVAKAVSKYAGREWKKVKRLRPLPGSKDAPSEPTTDQATALGRWHGRWPADYEAAAARVEEALDLIDNEESKRMCRLLIEHNGKRSAVAREMKIDEGTVRYRIERILQPKLLSIGFDLFGERDTP